MEEVLSFFKENPTFFIATVEGDQPRVRPFGAVTEFEGKLYIGTNNTKKVFDQMQKNPKVEICGMGKQGTYVRVDGKVYSEDSTKVRAKMLEEYPMLKNMYSVDDGVFEVLYLKDATATFASMKGVEKTVCF